MKKQVLLYSQDLKTPSFLYSKQLSYIHDFNISRIIMEAQKQPPELFYKKGVLKVLQNSQENTCTRVSFLIKLQACKLIKRDPHTGVFLWILQNFYEHLFYRTPPDDCFWNYRYYCHQTVMWMSIFLCHPWSKNMLWFRWRYGCERLVSYF